MLQRSKSGRHSMPRLCNVGTSFAALQRSRWTHQGQRQTTRTTTAQTSKLSAVQMSGAAIPSQAWFFVSLYLGRETDAELN